MPDSTRHGRHLVLASSQIYPQCCASSKFCHSLPTSVLWRTFSNRCNISFQPVGGSNFALRNARLNLTCALSSVISATCTCEIVSLTAGRKTWYCGRDAVILEGLKSLRLSDGRERRYLDILMASRVVGKANSSWFLGVANGMS